MAASRDIILAIQGCHRVERRHGEEPSQTPSMSYLLCQQQPANIASTVLPVSSSPDLQNPTFDLPPVTQPTEPVRQGTNGEEMGAVKNNQQAVPPRLPRRGPMLT